MLNLHVPCKSRFALIELLLFLQRGHLLQSEIVNGIQILRRSIRHLNRNMIPNHKPGGLNRQT